jgi:hypothetical protein
MLAPLRSLSSDRSSLPYAETTGERNKRDFSFYLDGTILTATSPEDIYAFLNALQRKSLEKISKEVVVV